jgi:hypothetical protein
MAPTASRAGSGGFKLYAATRKYGINVIGIDHERDEPGARVSDRRRLTKEP